MRFFASYRIGDTNCLVDSVSLFFIWAGPRILPGKNFNKLVDDRLSEFSARVGFRKIVRFESKILKERLPVETRLIRQGADDMAYR